MRAITPHLITNKPTPFTVRGDLAGAEVTALAERLWSHLLTAPPETVVDLAAAGDIDSAGADLLAAADAYAVHRGLRLRVTGAAPRVRTALHAAGIELLPPGGAVPRQRKSGRRPAEVVA
ncbi:STAS domain-containing protein [Saccharopolyspora sp. NPDC047091]|uniref:STAS domain-containing protein n=1 Tax=Saccharopolyspora sp. NPDC047091 TaxID=3155924 RepID=UPI0033C61522